MARFVFTLQPLLDARRIVEQGRQRAVAQLERDRLGLEQTLHRHQSGLLAGKATLRESLVGTLDLRAIRLHAAQSISIIHKAQRAVLELAGVHRRLDAARAALAEAARNRRAIEWLGEQRLARWRADLAKAESAAVDELAVLAAARGRSHQ